MTVRCGLGKELRPQPPFAAVVFDMDGLLLDTERLAYEALQEVCVACGVGVSMAAFRSMIGLNAVSSFTILEAELAGRVSARVFESAWDEAIDRRYAEAIPVKPGAVEVLDLLSSAALPLAVATSTRAERAIWKLERAGLAPHFAHVVCGDQVSRSKPEPDIFLEAARRLGVDPRTCVAFEDSEHGVRAAHAAGMTVVQVPDLVPPTPELMQLGHRVAATLLAGAAEVGLLHGADLASMPFSLPEGSRT